jgi:uncharacterized OB-fold protein
MNNHVANTERKTIALQEGLFAPDGEQRYHLLANRCPSCELTFFPARKYCGKCSTEQMETITLSDRGTIYSYSLIDRKSKVALVEPPYLQVEVAMPEGVHVFSVLDQCDAHAVEIGMPVEVYVGKVKQDEDGNDIVTYKFKPVA